MKTKRLSTKVAISTMTGVAVIIAIIYLAYLSHKEFEETVVFQTQQQLLTTAKTTAKGLEKFIEGRLEALEGLATIPSLQEECYNKVELTKHHEGFCPGRLFYEMHKDDVDALYHIDSDGVILERHPFKEKRVGSSLANRPGVSYVLKEHKPHVSEMFLSGSGKPSIAILEPVFYKNEFAGIVRYLIHVDTIYKNFIQPLKAGKKSYAWLLDDSGIMLAHPKAEHVGKDIMAPRKERFPDYDWTELENIVENMANGQEGVGIYHSAWWTKEKPERVKKLTAYAPVHVGNELWSIAVSMGYSEIAGPINEHSRNVIGIGGLVLLLFGAIGVGVGTYVIRSQRETADAKAEAKYFKQLSNGAGALRESENKYRTLLENLPQRIFFKDKNSVYISCNENYARDRNIKPDEITGKTLYDFFPKELAEKYRADDKRIMESGNTEDLEEEYVQDGQKLFVHTVKTPVKDENGNLVGILGILRDITERKLAQEALRQSEEKYRTILESIEDGYFEVDLAGNLTFFNDSLCKMTGSSKDELMGMNYHQYTDSENAERVYQVFNKVYSTGEPAKGFDWDITIKDGSKKHIDVSVSLIRHQEGQPIGFRGIMRDVTARKQMETELTQTKNFLQSILDSSIDGITTTDLQGNVIYTSPRTKDILGYRKEKIIGKKAHSFYGNGKEDAKAIMKELTAKGELRDHEMKFIRKDGELIDINLSASLLRNEEGEVIGTVGIYRDITEKNMLEAQLAQAQRMESIGTLAGGMAHNFNNLLMGIQGNASIMLLDVDSTHPHHERLKSIEEGVQKGSRLTRQLLGYARGGKYEPRPISLNQLVKGTSNTFGETRKEVVLHRELAEGLYGIKADRSQIEQTLLNLYVNAADAMADGGDLFLKTINVTYKDMKGKPYEAKPGNYVLLTVRDTGIGMDEKTKDRIFDPFFTTKGLAKSTGLGLASVYGIVKAHGGYIDVESKRGQGTTFEIYLPATQKQVKEEKKFSGQPVKGKGTILLVDDEEMVIDVGEQMLKKLGYEVYLAKSGQEAIDVYRENKDKIDMVLLDIVMPGMGGGKTYDSLREIDSDIKVLLSSGYDIEGKAKDILERGCDAFIQKPFNMRELSQEVRKILDRVS